MAQNSQKIQSFYPENFDFENHVIRRSLHGEDNELVDEEEFTVVVENNYSNGIRFIYSFCELYGCREWTPKQNNYTNSEYYKRSLDNTTPDKERDPLYYILANIEHIDEFQEDYGRHTNGHPYDLTVSFCWPPLICKDKEEKIVHQFQIPWEIDPQQRVDLIQGEKENLDRFIEAGMRFTDKITAEQKKIEEQYTAKEIEQNFASRFPKLHY